MRHLFFCLSSFIRLLFTNSMNMEIIPGLPNDIAVECLMRTPYQDFSSAASVCKDWKHEIELPEFWTRRKVAGVSRKIVVMAQARVDSSPEINKHIANPVYGLTVCEPETGYWAELPPIRGYSNGLPVFCQIVRVGLSLIVLAGLDPVTWEVTNNVFVYNFVSATWRRGADMPGGRRSFFACASDGDRTVFVAGGHDGDKCALKSTVAYDVIKDEWALLPDMVRERDESKGIFLRGKFHVIGGYKTSMQGRFEASAEVFDIATWRWLPVEEDFLSSPVCPKNCVDDGNGRLYMCHGADVASRQESTWQVLCELPSDVRYTMWMTAWQGKMWVMGSEGFGAPHHAYLLDLKSYKWERVEAPKGYTGHVQSGCCLEL